jgi:hypothetical protein
VDDEFKEKLKGRNGRSASALRLNCYVTESFSFTEVSEEHLIGD